MTAKITSKLDTTGRVSVPRTVRDSWDMGSTVNLGILRDGRGIRLSEAFGTKDAAQTLNSQNRLFIPAELRERLGWAADLQLEWKVADQFVLIGDDLRVCEICYGDQALAPVRHTFLCGGCLDEAGKNKRDAWEDPLARLVSRYTEACSHAVDGEMADLNEAYEIGSELRFVLEFLEVPATHALAEAVEKAQKRLRKVLVPARMIDSCEAWETLTGKKKRAIVYGELRSRASEIKEKQTGKLKKLHTIINDDFEYAWQQFKEQELGSYVEECDVSIRLKTAELEAEEAKNGWKKAKGSGEESFRASLEAAEVYEHALARLIAVKRYVTDTGERAATGKLEKMQNRLAELSRITDVKARLDELDRIEAQIDVKKKHIRGVKKEMLGEV
ncbi:hypothetical protein CR205_11955 [Alteribacter lacisalsi]|uniref:Uncharacterized protein n=1 Tax=Alteribacter lacisalsi TaxID=2045244 RepID=A0A2W0H8M6_9BACI|nr:hypothetical protein [Alteribacter lacisalsi]PYZ96430.1 hypothetical protein CR205_11955 [Alteribacter lacisalsi]